MFDFYNEYAIRFRENSAREGLSYTFRQGLSVIPAAAGHFLDTLLGLDGVILRDKDSHFSGPFGLLAGGIPFVLGYFLGSVLQFIWNCPGYIGYYLVDYPLSYIILGFLELINYANPDFERSNFYGSMQRVKFYQFMLGFPFLNILLPVLVSLTEKNPTYMQGPVGFIAGLVPHLSRYLIHRVVGTVTSCIQYFTDGVCDLVRSFYSKIKSCCCGRSPARSQEPASESGPENPSTKKKKSRIHLPQDIGQEANSDLRKVLEEELDLFAIMGVKKEEYENDRNVAKKAYRQLVLKVYPDKQGSEVKSGSGDAPSDWETLRLANTILSDSNLSAEYIKRYNSDRHKYSKNPTNFFPKPIDAASSRSAVPSGAAMLIKSRAKKTGT